MKDHRGFSNENEHILAKNEISSIRIYHQLLKELKEGNVKPWYCLVGKESFFLDQLQKAFLELIPTEARDFNADLLYGKEYTTDKVLSIARSFPMMSERRLVVVRDFLALGEDSEESTSWDDFIPYLEHPNPTSILVLIDEHRRPNARTKFGKALKKSKQGFFSAFDAIGQSDLVDWVGGWANTRFQKQIDRQAAEFLAFIVGDDLQKLSTEIEKVCTFQDSSKRVSVEDIKKITGYTGQYSVFDLKGSLMDKKEAQSIAIAEHLLNKADNVTGEAIRLVSFLFSQFATLWQVRRLLDKGMNPQDIKSELKLGPAFFYTEKEARKCRSGAFPRIFEALLDADMAIKGYSKMKPDAVIYLTLHRIINA